MGLKHPLAPRPISSDKADMGQITSREELEAWLKDKPIDFAQVIAARAALRVLPYAFEKRTSDEWVATHSLALFRATTISWAACNFPAHDMKRAADAGANAAYFAHADDGVYVDAAYAAYGTARAAAGAIYAGVTDDHTGIDYVAYVAAKIAFDTASFAGAAVWVNINCDCKWLTSEGDAASASRRLTREPLWPAGESDGLAEAWAFATGRLAALNQGYSVWIDWYDRRIKGERAAFDIPGDTRRKEDKAILIALADTTDEDFWNKGATHVNTTLQGWITQARQRASAKAATVAEIEMAQAPKPVAPERINFFISYATVDEAMAREVEAVLAELGYTSIAQFKDFKQSSFVRSMREGLAKSERFIALYSEAYWSSDHCQSEWDAAYARDPGAKQRKIVPFLLEAMDLRQQPLASEIVYERLHGLSKDERKKVIKQMIEFQPNAPLA
jgi:hypothetical protein